jgi:hypothetical protein
MLAVLIPKPYPKSAFAFWDSLFFENFMVWEVWEYSIPSHSSDQNPIRLFSIYYTQNLLLRFQPFCFLETLWCGKCGNVQFLLTQGTKTQNRVFPWFLTIQHPYCFLQVVYGRCRIKPCCIQAGMPQ